MKINILLLAVLLSFAQLLNAQSKTSSTPNYEPAPNTVKVDFKKGYTVSEQKTVDGNRMVVAYEQGLKYSLSITAVYPKLRSDKMDADMEGTFKKLIADQAKFVKDQTKLDLTYEKQSISGLAGQSGFAASFVIGEYTYAYRVVVVDNVMYMLGASSLTENRNNEDIVTFFNSFASGKEPVIID